MCDVCRLLQVKQIRIVHPQIDGLVKHVSSKLIKDLE